MTKQRDSKSGQIILILCLTFPVLLFLGGLTMDMVYIYTRISTLVSVLLTIG